MEWSQSGFAERLEEALERRGLTQIKFCAEHGFNRGTLSGWKEKSEPSYEDMYRLAEELGVRPGWLYFNDEFEAADDEEKSLLDVWRKMTEAERNGFLNTFKAIADARASTKKPGKRTKASSSEPLPPTPLGQPAESPAFDPLPLLSAEQYRELMDFLLKNYEKSEKRELPLMQAINKVVPFLRRLDPSATLPSSPVVAATKKDPAAGEKSSGESRAQRSANPRTKVLSSASKAPPSAT